MWEGELWMLPPGLDMPAALMTSQQLCSPEQDEARKASSYGKGSKDPTRPRGAIGNCWSVAEGDSYTSGYWYVVQAPYL